MIDTAAFGLRPTAPLPGSCRYSPAGEPEQPADRAPDARPGGSGAHQGSAASRLGGAGRRRDRRCFREPRRIASRRPPRSGRSGLHRSARGDRGAGIAPCRSSDLPVAGIRRLGWPDQLRSEPHRLVPPGRRLCRKDPQRRQAGRSASPAADHIRAGHQSRDRQNARPHRAAINPRPRRRGHRMRRRELMMLLGGAVTAAPALRAEQKAMPVIGFLSAFSPGPAAPFAAGVRRGLSETGYVEGQSVTIEYRWAEDHYDRLPALAADPVGRKVDVILASGGDVAAFAAKGATSTIPIVFAIGGDPVERGLVASLARPGGNLTGISVLAAELNPKRLELLSELVPQAGVIALLGRAQADHRPQCADAASQSLRSRRPIGTALTSKKPPHTGVGGGL